MWLDKKIEVFLEASYVSLMCDAVWESMYESVIEVFPVTCAYELLYPCWGDNESCNNAQVETVYIFWLKFIIYYIDLSELF